MHIRNNKPFILCFAVIVFLFNLDGYGQKDPTTSLLWKVSGNGLEKDSYLFGTIHKICQSDFFLTRSTLEAIDNAEQIVMEIDMDDPELNQKMQSVMFNPGMANLSESLDSVSLNTMNKFFTKYYGQDLTKLGVFKPFVLLTLVVDKAFICDSISVAYELKLLELAAIGNKEVLGLETAEYQINLFADIPADTQYDWLLEGLNDMEKMQNDLDNLVSAYKEQDLDALYEIFIRDPQYREYLDRLLFQRNENWIEPMEALMKEKSSFFAVGAGHLPGEKGVIALLQNAGYDVVPVLDN